MQRTRGSHAKDSGVFCKGLGSLKQKTRGSHAKDSGVSCKRPWGLMQRTPGSHAKDPGVSCKGLRGLMQRTRGSHAKDSGVSCKGLRGPMQRTPGFHANDSAVSCKGPEGLMQRTPRIRFMSNKFDRFPCEGKTGSHLRSSIRDAAAGETVHAETRRSGEKPVPSALFRVNRFPLEVRADKLERPCLEPQLLRRECDTLSRRPAPCERQAARTPRL
jgi:hypothetical protein